MTKVLIIGGGYAGSLLARTLDPVLDVVLVEPREAFVHNVGAPRALADPALLNSLILPYDRLLARGTVVRDRAVAIAGTAVTLAGGSRIDSNFLKGIADSPSPGKDKVSPGEAQAQVPVAALINAISRQIKPHWSAPQGVDAEKLVTVLAWSLNPDGTLAGRPTVVSQTGITDANRAQAQRHAELAIRAVQLAAPFNLPPAAYAQWRRVIAFRFDRKLSQ